MNASTQNIGIILKVISSSFQISLKLRFAFLQLNKLSSRFIYLSSLLICKFISDAPSYFIRNKEYELEAFVVLYSLSLNFINIPWLHKIIIFKLWTFQNKLSYFFIWFSMPHLPYIYIFHRFIWKNVKIWIYCLSVSIEKRILKIRRDAFTTWLLKVKLWQTFVNGDKNRIGKFININKYIP